jgi:hypothetical protein
MCLKGAVAAVLPLGSQDIHIDEYGDGCMQEQLIELSVRPFDLTAVNRFVPIEHVHEQVCIVRGRFGGIAENLYFTLSKR